jgi:CHAD domain-containing protein
VNPPATLRLFGAANAGPALARAIGARRGIARPVAPDTPDAPAFLGTERRLTVKASPGLDVRLREGSLGTGKGRRRCCIVSLTGAAEDVGRAALLLAAAGAALEAPSPPDGAALLQPGQSPDDAFASLLDVLGAAIRWHAPGAIAGRSPEPVHQMRVAVRRLRSAIGLFRRAAAGNALAEAADELKALMALLGPARDWDVFLAGTGVEIAVAFPDDADVGALLAAARRRRGAAYRALQAHLRGPAFAMLGVRLAWLAAMRPWQTPPDAPDALTKLGRRMLGQRWARMTRGSDGIAEWPAPRLHALRLHGKRMRYASEFFQPLFPGRATRRWIRRLARLQERLGSLNDTAVAAHLLGELGQAGSGFGGGLVQGYLAANAARARPRIARAWGRLARLEPFWE